MKKTTKGILGFIVYTLTTLVLFTAAGFYWLAEEFQARGPLETDTLIHVQRGSGLHSISAMLEERGIIEHKEVFTIGTRILRSENDLKAGEFQIKAGASPKDVMLVLRDGKAFGRQVTVPEGLTSYEIVQRLKEADELSGEITEIPAEGTLLPQTYHFERGESRADVIARMRAAMDVVLNDAWEKRAIKLPLKTKAEALILASIVEKETGVPSERARIAGVFINRLKRGMKLQTDPSVIYALTGGAHENEGQGPIGRRLLRKDLGFDSPYNTYLYKGLPPGPIANPGEDAIRATLNPEDHDYLYFVADGSGGHAFAKTLREHNENVAKWRKVRAAR